jgi:hypothetical protein
VAARLGLPAEGLASVKNPGGGLQGASRDQVWFIKDDKGRVVAVAKVFTDDTRFFREFASLDRLRTGVLPASLTPRDLIAERAVQGANNTSGVIVMAAAPGRSLADRVSDRLLLDGQDLEASRRGTMRAVRSNMNALAELHTRPPGSGGQVAPEYIDQAITHIGNTIGKLQQFEGLLQGELDLDAVRRRVGEYAAAMRTNPGVAGLAHGDAHPGNLFHHPRHGTTLIDLPNLYFSIGEGGRPIGMPARDIGTYYQSLGTYALQNRVPEAEMEVMLEEALRSYRQSGGAPITQEAMTFYRCQAALSDVVFAARDVDVSGRRVTSPDYEELDRLEQHLTTSLNRALDVLALG